MKRDIHGRFSKTDTIEFPLPSISFIAKYFLLLIILLPWIYLAIYRLCFIIYSDLILVKILMGKNHIK